MSNSSSIAFFFFLLLLLPPPPPSAVAAPLDPRDYLALQSIRASLWDLPGSSFFFTWDFTSDPCSSFSGVLCSAGRVTSLSLGDPRAGSPGLSGHLPPALSRLSALAALSLVPGRVYGPIPPSLSLCSDLRFLALSHNYLSGAIPPSLLSSLRLLRTLDLSFNLLTGPVPNHHTSPSLTNLILSHNHLAGEIPDLSSSSSNLIRLDLKRNNLSGGLPSLPTSLKYLSLSSNRLSGGIGRVIIKLSNLNYLDLSGNELSGQIPSVLFSFPVSGGIYLQRNKFSGTIRTVGPVAARTVDLSYNSLTGTIPAGLAMAERVYLNVNRFYGRVPGRFGERVRRGEMKVLYLQHNFLVGMDGLGGGGAVVPRSVSLCLNFNCMVPPEGSVCPVRVGRWKSRPAEECRGWRKKGGSEEG